MTQFHTHVCMVSGQAAPNLLPLLDPTLKPKEVILLATPQMAGKVESLRHVIQPLGIKVEASMLDAADDYSAVQEVLLNLLSTRATRSIALNVTGGTKLMAIAAQEVFRSDGRPVFYVNLDDDTVIFVGEQKSRHQLQRRIHLRQFLEVNGYALTSDTKPVGMSSDYKDLMQSLIMNVEQWGQALGQLNFLASDAADQGRLTINLAEIKRPDQHLPALVKKLQQANLLRQQPTDFCQFSNDDCRGFANGGWLEAYINSKLNELKAEGVLQDSAALNLQVEYLDPRKSVSNTKGTRNELDVAFMARNRLHIIECKTKRFAGNEAGTEALYKLDSISALGGLGTKAMLVSYRKLNQADQQRARDLRIKTVETTELQNLKTHLCGWIEKNS